MPTFPAPRAQDNDGDTGTGVTWALECRTVIVDTDTGSEGPWNVGQ